MGEISKEVEKLELYYSGMQILINALKKIENTGVPSSASIARDALVDWDMHRKENV